MHSDMVSIVDAVHVQIQVIQQVDVPTPCVHCFCFFVMSWVHAHICWCSQCTSDFLLAFGAHSDFLGAVGACSDVVRAVRVCFDSVGEANACLDLVGKVGA